MSRSTTAAPPKPSRREELVGFAAEVFAEKGVAQTTVRDIADMAGILSGSLYHHFESKEQIVAEVLAEGLRVGGERDAEIIADAKDPASAMTRLIISFVVWVGDHPQVARILANDQQYLKDTPSLAPVEKQRQALCKLWTDVVADGIAQTAFAPVDPDIVVRAIFDGALASVRWLPPIGRSNPAEVGEELARFYVAGLRGGA